MRIEVSVEKKWAFAIVASVLVLSGVIFVVAQWSDPEVWHGADSVKIDVDGQGNYYSLQEAVDLGLIGGSSTGDISYGCFPVQNFDSCRSFYSQGFYFINGHVEGPDPDPTNLCCTASNEFEIKEFYAVYDNNGGGDPDCWIVSENKYKRSYGVPDRGQNNEWCPKIPQPDGHLDPRSQDNCIQESLNYYNEQEIDGRTGGWTIIHSYKVRDININSGYGDPCNRDFSAELLGVGVKRNLA